jgi:hypothetical protein
MFRHFSNHPHVHNGTTSFKMPDIYWMCGRAYGSEREARRFYHEHAPHRRISDRKKFSTLDERQSNMLNMPPNDAERLGGLLRPP